MQVYSFVARFKGVCEVVVGSCEWFAENAKKRVKIEYRESVEKLREAFLKRFSPSRLKTMTGEELLNQVFDNTTDTMMHLLMYDPDYRMGFGASSEYPYMSIIYKGHDGLWSLFEKNKHIKMNKEEATVKAEEVRDDILKCVDIISVSRLRTAEDYKILEKRLSQAGEKYNYVTLLKYYHMIFPQYFPGMYSDFTLTRCIQILGLKYMGKSSNKRIQNMGVISLFIRNCGINSNVFGSIYADEWDWIASRETCPAANDNETKSLRADEVELSLYSKYIGR